MKNQHQIKHHPKNQKEENKEVNLDKKNEIIKELAAKKTPTPEKKLKKVKKKNQNLLPCQTKKGKSST